MPSAHVRSKQGMQLTCTLQHIFWIFQHHNVSLVFYQVYLFGIKTRLALQTSKQSCGALHSPINGCMLYCRSILPENLHFDKDLNIKLTHFASALDLGAGHVPQGPEAFSVVDYLAPEVPENVTASTQLLHVVLCLGCSGRGIHWCQISCIVRP